MNLNALKSFAPRLRRQLMDAVGRKLDYVLTAETADLRAAAIQVASLRRQTQRDRAGLVERVAYTWFNRLAALRFLDARGWHPFGARVLTPASANETQPDLLKLMRSGALPPELARFTNVARLNDLLDGRLPTAAPGADPQGEVYRELILAACRFYHDRMPFLFEALDDETELLLPDDLLTEQSVAEGFRAEISDEDCGDGQRANVEILGWLYQFYISEKKDAVMARKSAVPTEDIPAVTQLFTPHWIVRYLVENSLGRIWLLNRPGSRLREHMPYYIEGEKNAPGGSPAETDFLKITKPEEIRLCDPAVGSAHMLTYAFDLLFLIYEEEGYAPTEIPALILRHNLHGLEICPRAAQLAELALVFKAREKSRRFFQPEHLVRPRIIELRDVRFAENELRDYIHALGLGDLFNQPVLRLLHQFEEAKNFGSLIQPCLDERAVADSRRAIEAKDLGGQLFLRETHLKVLRVLEQAEALTQRYHVVVANPPYMGAKGMNGFLKTFLQENFTEYKTDLFSAFIVRSLSLALGDGFLGFMSPFVWMFISSYEELRKLLISQATITTLVQLEYSGFDGATVPICTFTLQNKQSTNYRGGYVRLSQFRGSEQQGPRTLEAIANPKCGWFFRANAEDFKKIPGCPIAYWVSENMRAAFQGRTLADLGKVGKGSDSGDNGKFIRSWSEVSFEKIGFRVASRDAAMKSGKRFFPTHKGGGFRRWAGNSIDVVNWENDGFEIKAHPGSTTRNQSCYFNPCISWGKITSALFSCRMIPEGSIADDAGPSAYLGSQNKVALAVLNSCCGTYFLSILCPTLNFQVGDVQKVPLPGTLSNFDNSTTDALVEIATKDWDNFETSWDFRDQPLLRPGLKGATLEASWRKWEAQSTAAIRRMQELETENNRLFIAAYGLDGELQPEVPEAQITLARAEARRDMAAFLSYAVGCMMGRYSPMALT